MIPKIAVMSGTVHGYLVRGDTADPAVKKTVVDSIQLGVDFINEMKGKVGKL